MSFHPKHAFLSLSLLILAACGSSGGSSTATCTGDNVTTACTNTYNIRFDAANQKTGRSSFTLTVKNHDGNGVSGATVTLLPWMRMATMNHASVVDSVTDNGDGTYTCVVYYLMSSSMGGQSMGTWDMGVTVNGESATFTPVEVGMPMGETVKVNLSLNSDQYSKMGTATTRTWSLFKESVNANGVMKVVVTTVESMSNFPKVATGATLTDATGGSWTVDSLVVELSTDKATWLTATENGDGHFTVMGLTGLADGVASNVYVKLTVNGYPYTTDGANGNGANDYQTFVVIPGAMGAGM
ncbi:MAG: hypothetical protein HQK87_02190 [Nitrospinae bacterium]|nr:hypothetical protein [Nitrospinota bacterium]